MKAQAEPAGRGRSSALARRLLPLAALALIAIGYRFWAPAQTTLAYELGAERQGLCSLEIDLFRLPGRELARRARFLYSPAAPAPSLVLQHLRLERGDYEADADLGACDGAHRRREIRFRFEGQAYLTLSLTDS